MLWQAGILAIRNKWFLIFKLLISFWCLHHLWAIFSLIHLTPGVLIVAENWLLVDSYFKIRIMIPLKSFFYTPWTNYLWTNHNYKIGESEVVIPLSKLEVNQNYKGNFPFLRDCVEKCCRGGSWQGAKEGVLAGDPPTIHKTNCMASSALGDPDLPGQPLCHCFLRVVCSRWGSFIKHTPESPVSSSVSSLLRAVNLCVFKKLHKQFWSSGLSKNYWSKHGVWGWKLFARIIMPYFLIMLLQTKRSIICKHLVLEALKVQSQTFIKWCRVHSDGGVWGNAHNSLMDGVDLGQVSMKGRLNNVTYTKYKLNLIK